MLYCWSRFFKHDLIFSLWQKRFTVLNFVRWGRDFFNVTLSKWQTFVSLNYTSIMQQQYIHYFRQMQWVFTACTTTCCSQGMYMSTVRDRWNVRDLIFFWTNFLLLTSCHSKQKHFGITAPKNKHIAIFIWHHQIVWKQWKQAHLPPEFPLLFFFSATWSKCEGVDLQMLFHFICEVRRPAKV